MLKNLLLILAFTISLLPQASKASSCHSPEFDEAYRNAVTVFSGKIIDGTGTTSCGSKKMLLRVMNVYKGNPGNEVEITSLDSCVGPGVYLIKGEQYMLYATKIRDESLSVWSCSWTKPLSSVKPEELEQLQKKKALGEEFDDVIKNHPNKALSALRSKAEYFLYWQDLVNAEAVLKQIVLKSPTDPWAFSELVRILYEQRKAEDIWILYTAEDKQKLWLNVTEFDRYISFSAVKLNKDLPAKHHLVLEGLDFKGTTLTNHTFEQPEIKDVSFTDANLDGLRFSGGKITNLKINNGSLSNASFNQMTLKDVKISQSNLQRIDFSKSVISKLALHASDLSGAKFQGAEIYDGRFNRQDFKNADLSDSKILNSHLEAANLKNAVLKGISLKETVYDCETQWPEGFDPIAAGAIKEYCGEVVNTTVPVYSESLQSTELVGKNFSGQALGKVDYHGKNLKETNFSDAELESVNLEYSDLTKADFHWAKMNNSRLGYAVIKNTNFGYANLRRARFKQSEIRSSSFKYSVMEGVKIERVKAHDVDFSYANFFRAEITDSDMQGLIFQHAHLDGASFQGSNFSKTDFSGSSLNNIKTWEENNIKPVIFQKANFSGASLNNADLRGADFSEATFDGATLLLAQYDCSTKWPEGFNPGKQAAVLRRGDCEPKQYYPPQLKDKNLSQANLEGLNFKEADLTGAILRGAKLRQADLSSANLENINLTAAIFDCQTLWPVNFDPIKEGAILSLTPEDTCADQYGHANLEKKDLQDMDLFDAPLSKANMRGANLSGVSMGRADLFQANLTDANVRGADMSRANLREAIVKGALYDCNTLWPDGYNPEEGGAQRKGKICVEKNQRVERGVRALLNDWRKPPAAEGFIIENKKLPWFDAQRRSIENTVFKNVLMRKAYFGQIHLNSVDFISSDLSDANFEGIKLDKVNFSNSNLRNANFKNGQMHNVNFSGADIRGANFDKANMQDVKWGGVIYDCNTIGIPLEEKSCEKD